MVDGQVMGLLVKCCIKFLSSFQVIQMKLATHDLYDV